MRKRMKLTVTVDRDEDGRWMRAKQRGHGFTLIELLVVIAIIAMLAALMLPALAKAKNASHKVSCLSNLHQMGVGLLMYADDSGGFIPRGNDPLWWEVLAPQFSARATTERIGVKIYTCPSYPDKRQQICYVVNAWQFDSRFDPVGSEVVGLTKLNRIQQPVDTVYFADNEDGSWRPVISDLGTIGSTDKNDVWNPSHLPYATGSRTLNPERRVARARHSLGANLLFFDGHSEWKKAEDITVGDWREVKY